MITIQGKGVSTGIGMGPLYFYRRNKTEIKKAVSEIFGVKVEKVTTINMDGKQKRQGRYPAGRTASFKKAVVRLTADSKTIEFFEGMV